MRKFYYFVNSKLLRMKANSKTAGPKSWVDNKGAGEFSVGDNKGCTEDKVQFQLHIWAMALTILLTIITHKRYLETMTNRNIGYIYINIIGSSMNTPAQFFVVLKNLKFRHYWGINRGKNMTYMMPRFIWFMSITRSRVQSPHLLWESGTDSEVESNRK